MLSILTAAACLRLLYTKPLLWAARLPRASANSLRSLQAHRLRHTQSCVSNNGGQAVGIGGPMRPGGGQCSCIRKGASSWPWCKAAEAVNTLSRDDEHMSVPNADVFEVCLRDSSNNVFPELCIGNMDEDEAIYYRDLCLAL